MSQDRTWILLGRKISGEATLDELRELEMLLKEDAQLSYQASLIKELELSTPDNTGDTENALEKHMLRMQELYPEDFQVPVAIFPETPENRSWIRKNGIPALVATVLLIVVVLGGIWSLRDRKQGGKELVSEISTRHGSRTMVTLPDGSVVFLNVSSKLTYDYGKEDSRQVVLEGEAFFDVHKDEQRPFIIHTRKMDITVLGTTFNVRAYEEDKTVETSLIQGKVEVTIKGEVPKKVILSPNQKIILFNEAQQQPKVISVPVTENPDKEPYRLEEVTVNPNDSLVAETAWKENCLVFNDERFADIALKMERWYDVRIIFEDKEVEDYRFTGTFINETVAQTLEALRFTSPFRYNIDKKKIIIKR
ncbi:FecR family protein [Chitinophaga sp. S165]|uniref:FecR family protein n=1 Tax=Chitinophaga sp. S165 TaxID=2135462 RepID=UPI000D717311|nr:FecR domain-containing protein [Chitinophaga sp. S165]PWV45620.1 FecR family protein [Chitinophaga sp. S165]